jgi:hypothetical protein
MHAPVEILAPGSITRYARIDPVRSGLARSLLTFEPRLFLKQLLIAFG